MKKNIAILGSTGSIGRQTLEVVSAFPDNFNVVGIAAKDEVELIVEQIKKFSPDIISVESESVKEKILKGFPEIKSQIVTGIEGLITVTTFPSVEMIVGAIPGVMTLIPLIKGIEKGKNIALATKEVLTAAGEILMKKTKEHNVKIFPIDSEHSAIAQCLKGEDSGNIKRVIVTCSGGPFIHTPVEQLEHVTIEDVLKHPTWKMGPNITVESASLMNKGFEVIETHFLFDLDYSKIDVVVHPQSIIHSMVEFVDGSVKAMLGPPDMRPPIQYALFEMNYKANYWNILNFPEIKTLTFEKPDTVRFPCLKYAYEAGKKGGTYPAVLNAVNEESVKLFLNGKIPFLEIPKRIKKVLDAYQGKSDTDIDAILEADKWARDFYK